MTPEVDALLALLRTRDLRAWKKAEEALREVRRPILCTQPAEAKSLRTPCVIPRADIAAAAVELNARKIGSLGMALATADAFEAAQLLESGLRRPRDAVVLFAMARRLAADTGSPLPNAARKLVEAARSLDALFANSGDPTRTNERAVGP